VIRIHYFYKNATLPIRTYFMDFENSEKEYATKFYDGMIARGFEVEKKILNYGSA